MRTETLETAVKVELEEELHSSEQAAPAKAVVEEESGSQEPTATWEGTGPEATVTVTRAERGPGVKTEPREAPEPEVGLGDAHS